MKEKALYVGAGIAVGVILTVMYTNKRLDAAGVTNFTWFKDPVADAVNRAVSENANGTVGSQGLSFGSTRSN